MFDTDFLYETRERIMVRLALQWAELSEVAA